MVQKNEEDYDCNGYYFVMYKLFSSKPVKGFKCGVMLECQGVQAKARASAI